MFVCAFTNFVLYPLHKFRLTLSFSYLWICHISVVTLFHFLSMYYVHVRLVHLFSFVSTLWRRFFVQFSFVATLYTVLSPSVSTLDSIPSHHVFILDSISYWFELTLTTFLTLYICIIYLFRPKICIHDYFYYNSFSEKGQSFVFFLSQWRVQHMRVTREPMVYLFYW